MANTFGKAVRDKLTDSLANKTFRARNLEQLIGISEDKLKATEKFPVKSLNIEKLANLIVEHQEHQVPRLKLLNEYYQGKNPYINSPEPRRISEDASDIRFNAPKAKPITDIHTAYTFTNPIKIQGASEKILEFINNFDKINKSASKQVELGAIMSKYGRAYELLVIQESKILSAIVDVKTAFIVFDKSIFSNKLAGVRYILNDDDSEKFTLDIEVYTDKFTIILNVDCSYDEDKDIIESIGDVLSCSVEVHGFRYIPLLELKNNEMRQGDFEIVIPLIDSYDVIMSDTLNGYGDLSNEFLHLDANLGAEMTENTAKSLKDANIVATSPSVTEDGAVIPTKLQYVSRNFNFNNIESHLNNINQEIIKASLTPDISDSSFGGTQTGQSLRYKMTYLDQSFNIKKSIHSQYLIEKYKTAYLTIANTLDADVEEILNEFDSLEIIHSKNIPTTPLEEMQILSNLQLDGKLSLETVLSNLSFIKNVGAELKLIELENKNKNKNNEETEKVEEVEETNENTKKSEDVIIKSGKSIINYKQDE